jgi:hypothetical protein
MAVKAKSATDGTAAEKRSCEIGSRAKPASAIARPPRRLAVETHNPTRRSMIQP